MGFWGSPKADFLRLLMRLRSILNFFELEGCHSTLCMTE